MYRNIESEETNMKTIIDRSRCKPLSDNIEGKLVVIKSDFFNFENEYNITSKTRKERNYQN